MDPTTSGARRVSVPPMSARAVPVRAGDEIEIVDVGGQQVADTWAFDPGAALWLSTSHTRDLTERVFPLVGQCFVDQHYDPVLTFLEDRSPGHHDALYPACNPQLFAREGFPGHPNCADNCRDATREKGLSVAPLPDPVNFFQRSLPTADGSIVIEPAISAAGDSVVLRAERDLVLVVSACCVDFWPTNGDSCTDLEVRLSSRPAA